MSLAPVKRFLFKQLLFLLMSEQTLVSQDSFSELLGWGCLDQCLSEECPVGQKVQKEEGFRLLTGGRTLFPVFNLTEERSHKCLLHECKASAHTYLSTNSWSINIHSSQQDWDSFTGWGKGSRVTLPGTAASLVSCSTKTMEPLSPVCSCTHPKDSVRAPLASLTSASAEHRTSGALLARVRVWNHKHHVFLLPFSAPLFPPGPTGAETPSALMGNLGEEGQDSCNSSGLKERLQREGTWGDILTLLGKVGFSCSH